MHVQDVPKRLPFEVKRRLFEFECFNSHMNPFWVILAERITPMNLQSCVKIMFHALLASLGSWNIQICTGAWLDYQHNACYESYYTGFALAIYYFFVQTSAYIRVDREKNYRFRKIIVQNTNIWIWASLKPNYRCRLYIYIYIWRRVIISYGRRVTRQSE